MQFDLKPEREEKHVMRFAQFCKVNVLIILLFICVFSFFVKLARPHFYVVGTLYCDRIVKCGISSSVLSLPF